MNPPVSHMLKSAYGSPWSSIRETVGEEHTMHLELHHHDGKMSVTIVMPPAPGGGRRTFDLSFEGWKKLCWLVDEFRHG